MREKITKLYDKYRLKNRFNEKHFSQFSFETIFAMQTALSAAKNIATIDIKSQTTYKSGQENISTAWDMASETTIVNSIKNEFPQDAILSEESYNLSNPLDNKRLWVIDPIDGTHNADLDRGYFCISIGFLKDGKPFSGAVYNPTRDELFYAENTIGSFLNGKKITVSNHTDLATANISTDRSYDPAITINHLQMLIKTGGLPQMLGSSVLEATEIAARRRELFFHTDTKPWDNAGTICIVENAGGISRNLKGEEITIMSPEIVIGVPEIVNKFLKKIKS